jgi:serine protease AprX
LTRRRIQTAVLVSLALLGATLPSAQATAKVASHTTSHATVDPSLATQHGTVQVIVVRRSAGHAAEQAVKALGGTVTRDLALVHGFVARIPASKVHDLATDRAIASISLDRKVNVQSTQLPSGGGGNVYGKETRSDDVRRTGASGAGVTVALIDTGVSDLPDLAGRVLTVQTDALGHTAPCENLSGESDCRDSYGHGTFLAGLIAGTGAASGGAYAGVAPGASILSVKIAGRDGSADVSNVIAAIQWVVSFKDTYGVKVLNLSLGTDGTQSYRTDPLNYAVEKAWFAGITVVVSASNRGPAAGTIAKPGDDPWVITVGAVDDKGTNGIGDDRLPNFSSHGPTAADGLAKPDVVAPGARVVSLAAPGSALTAQFPPNMAAPYRRGSGTSMSAAIVSGAVALMLSQQPLLTPDRIKYALTSTARHVATNDVMAVGSGLVDVASALTAPPGVANVGNDRSTGLGTLDGSRGTVQVDENDPLNTVVGGTLTAQLLVWDPLTYTTVDWTGSNWYGSNWYGSNWYGSNWYGSNWYGSNWYGSNWYGEMEGSNWYGSNWYGSNWYGVWE